MDKSKQNASDGRKYRALQALKLIELFSSARGTEPRNTAELEHFVEQESQSGRLPRGPIDTWRDYD